MVERQSASIWGATLRLAPVVGLLPRSAATAAVWQPWPAAALCADGASSPVPLRRTPLMVNTPAAIHPFACDC